MPPKYDPVPVSAAVEVFFAGKKRQVQFLNGVFGLGMTEAKKSSQQVEIAGIKFFVLDPIACLESRIHNSYGLPGRHGERDLQRVRLAIRVARHRIHVVAQTHPRAALHMAERVLETARSPRAVMLFVNDAIDILEAIPGAGMPQQFYTDRLTRGKKWLSNKRERSRQQIVRFASSSRTRAAVGSGVKRKSK